MKLTKGSVGCLARGAAHKDPDVNAVGPNGDLFEAGQMVTEGDADLRRTLDIDEYRPVLEVVSTNWCGGNFTRWNEIGCLVTDGEETIFMKACCREKKRGSVSSERGAEVCRPSWLLVGGFVDGLHH